MILALVEAERSSRNVMGKICDKGKTISLQLKEMSAKKPIR